MKIKIIIILCLILYNLNGEEKEKIKVKVSTNPAVEGSFYLKQEKNDLNIQMKLNEELQLESGTYGFLFENDEYIGYTEQFFYKQKEEEVIIDIISKYD